MNVHAKYVSVVLLLTGALSPGLQRNVSAQSAEPRLFVVADTGSIQELDPVTGAVLRSIPTPEQGSAGPDGLSFNGTYLYYINAIGTGLIHELDPLSGESLRTIMPDVSCSIDALASSLTSLYGLCYDTSQIYLIDPETGLSQVVYEHGHAIIGGLTFAGLRQTLFVTSGPVILEVDPVTGAEVRSFDVGVQAYGLGFSNAADVLFASTDDGRILALDPTSGAVQYTITFGATVYALAADEVVLPEGPHLTVVPSTIDFGPVETGTSSSRSIRLASIGTEPLNVSLIAIESGDVVLSEGPALPIQVSPGEFITLAVTVTPTEAGPLAGTIRIESDDADQPITIIPVSAVAAVVQGAKQGLLYGSTGGNDGGRLILVDPVTGAGELIGDLPGDRFPSIAIDSRGRLFVATDQGELHRLDAATGASFKSVRTGLGRLAALAFDTEDVLYGIAYNQGLQLIRIDPATGRGQPVANISPSVNGMSFNPIDGTLWAASSDRIFTIDSATGTETVVGNTGFANATDIQFDSDGNLYAAIGGGREQNRLAHIDLASGAASIIGGIGFLSVSGLASFVSVPVGPQLALTPPSMAFGLSEAGSTVQRRVLLRNVGTEAVTVTAISSLAEPFVWAGILPTLPFTLQTGASVTLAANFSPVSTGSFDVSVIISSNDADQPERTLRFFGDAFELNTSDPGVCYGSTGQRDGGRLLFIDPETGHASVIADVAAARLPALAIDREGRMFGSDEIAVYRIDPLTGEAVRLGSSGGTALKGLAFATGDELLGVDDGRLYLIDPSTGRSAQIGETGISGIRGLAVNPADGSLWSASGGDIWRLNRETGVATLVGNTGLGKPLTDIAFDVSGTLFATAGGSQQENVLAAIDLSTGSAMVVGPLGYSSVSGFACDLRSLDGPHAGALPTRIDFGRVENIGSFSRSVTVRSVGTEPLTVTAVSEPDVPFGLTALPALPAVLQPRERLTFQVTLTPDASGSFSSSISVTTSDPDTPVASFDVTADVVDVSPAVAGVLYASTGDQDGGRLVSIDVTSGTATVLGDPGATRLPGLAIDSDGRVFASDSETHVHLLDASTGDIVRTVNVALGRLAALAFDDADVLHAIGFDANGQTVAEIDPSSGAILKRATLASTSNFNGMSFHPFDGALWAATDSDIFTVDVESGMITRVGAVGFPHVTDIQFDMDGRLFATAGGGMEDNRLLLVNQQTGVGREIGPIGIRSVSGLSMRQEKLQGSQLAIIPPEISLGAQEVGEKTVRAIALRSVGTEELIVGAITGIDLPFAIERQPSLPLTLQPGDVDTVFVSFAPLEAGIFEALMSVSSNDEDDPDRTVAINGKGFVLTYASPGILYGSTGSQDGGRLISIDPLTGAGTLVGNTSASRLPGLAIDSMGRIYAGDEQGWLHLLDAASGEIRRSVYTGLEKLPAIAFDPDDGLHAFSRDPFTGQSALYSLDPRTGASSIVTETTFDFRGMSFNPIDGSLWTTTSTAIYSFDIETGDATFLVEPWYTPDLQFDMGGTLYVVTGGGQGGNNQLLTVDQSTGTTTTVGFIGFGSVSGLSSRMSLLDGPHLTVAPPEVRFANVEVGLARSVSIFLRNVGTESVTVTALSEPSAPFSLADAPILPLVLKAGERQALSVDFAPTEQRAYRSRIIVSSNDPDEPERNVILRGEAFQLNHADVGVFYGSTGGLDGGRLIRIDGTTGEGSLAASTTAERLPGLAIDSRGRIYAADPEGRIYLLDATTGAVKATASVALWPLAAITFDQTDVLHAFAYGPAGPSLYTIDVHTGLRSLVGSTEREFKGASFNPVDGSLWTSGVDLQDPSRTAFYEVDPATGQSVLAGTVSLSNVTDIQFDLTGTLFATAGGGREENRLVRIDRMTWEPATVGPIGFTSVSGLAMRLVVLEGAHLVAVPVRVDFGTTRVGSSSTRSVGLVSIGTEAVTVRSVGPLDAPFGITDGPDSERTLQPGESLNLELTFEPTTIGDFASSLLVSSTDEDEPAMSILIAGAAKRFAVDGDLSDEEYEVLAESSFQGSFGPEVDVTSIRYTVGSEMLYLGFQGRVQNEPNQYAPKPDGLGVFLGSEAQAGAPAGASLGINAASDFHFLNGASEGGPLFLSFTADFEVDYMFAAYSDGSPNRLILDAGTHVAGKTRRLQRIGETDQGGSVTTGPAEDGVFLANAITFAFQPSTSVTDRKGLEVAIPLSELGGGLASNLIETFAFIVSSTGYFSNDVLPGVAANPTSLGFEPDFNGNTISVNCECSTAGQLLGSGPFHSSLVVRTGVEQTEIPTEFALHAAYPNPFNPSSTITYELPRQTEVQLRVFNVLGQHVVTLANGKMQAGRHRATFDAAGLASGVYFFRMEAGPFTDTKSMILTK